MTVTEQAPMRDLYVGHMPGDPDAEMYKAVDSAWREQFRSPLYEDEPTTQIPDLFSDPKGLISDIENGLQDPHELDLLKPGIRAVETYRNAPGSRPDKVKALIDDKTYTQARVAAWGVNGVEEAEIVKAQSMDELTESGEILKKMLVELMLDGDPELSTKKIGAWRVRTVGQKVMRKLSLDEVTQIAFNVFDLPGNPSQDPMKMDFIGAARPPLKHEIGIDGDNAYDDWCVALEDRAKKYGFSNYRDLYFHLGSVYTPGAFTYAGSRGHRQLSSPEGFGRMIDSILDHETMTGMSRRAQTVEASKILAGSMMHIALGTDAE